MQLGQGQGKSSSGLLEFSSMPTAVEALILANHYTMHREGMFTSLTFTFKRK